MTVRAASPTELRDRGPAALLAGGGFLIATLIGINLAKGVDLLTPIHLALFAVHFVLASTVAACGYRAAVTDLPPERYGRIAGWCLGGAGLFFVLHIPMIAVRSDLVTAVDWTHSAISFGAASGAVGGLIEARTIERARAAEREAVRAETAEEQVERLEYLNTLLRHEVLNNANIISGYAELALAERNGDVEDYLTVIRQQGENMSTVIEDIRVLIATLKNDEPQETINLSAILDDELEAVRTTYEDVEVQATVPTDVDVLADDLVQRIFGNLLSNAVEHNDTSTPRITVTVDRTPETVSVRIADNGPGIPEEKRGTIFENDVRDDHGVGLYLVELLAERYDGSIELTETGSEGSTFTVVLPRASEASDPPSRAAVQ